MVGVLPKVRPLLSSEVACSAETTRILFHEKDIWNPQSEHPVLPILFAKLASCQTHELFAVIFFLSLKHSTPYDDPLITKRLSPSQPNIG
jgi:hypothetical protein